jgi:RND family efflux transporter MFP subunit
MSIEELRIDRDRPRSGNAGRAVGAVLILLALAALFYGWRRAGARPLVSAAIAVETAAGGARETVLNASGYVTARRQATVSSKVTGQITEVLFEEGQKARTGQVLARIDPSNLNTSLALAQAQLDVARTALGETEAQYGQASNECFRVLSLQSNRVDSASEADKARADADSLKARLERQQAEVTVARRQIAIWQQQLDDTVIRAPFDGVIVSKTAQPGEVISPLSAGGGFTRTGICTLVDMSSLEVEVDVNENYIHRVFAGQPVEAVLDAYPDWKIPAHVIAIIPTADRQKGTVKVRIGFEALDPRMLPDMGV